MKAIRSGITVLAVLILVVSSTRAWGTAVTVAAANVALPGKVETQRLRWRTTPIKIAISNSLTRTSTNVKTDSDVVGAVRRSLQTWANAAGVDLQLEVSDRQNVSPNGASGDGVSLITIAQTPENVLFFARNADSASAKTRIFYNRKGFITEADIVLNPFQQFSTDGTFGTFDLESTVTHEIGHLLGLNHSGVWGSTMAENLSANGAMGLVDLSRRFLSQSDVAAIRDLYGAPTETEDCCGAISGKLQFGGRPGKNLQVWTEERGSGSVAGQSDTGPDGVFRIGGLPSGEYSIYWKTRDTGSTSSMGKVDTVVLESGETKTLQQKISSRPSDVVLQYVGMNGQLADYGISLKAGRSYVINLGGKNVGAGLTEINFSTPLIKMFRSPFTSQEFSDGVTGISFMITVDPDISPGQYSIYAEAADGTASTLVGAINIE